MRVDNCEHNKKISNNDEPKCLFQIHYFLFSYNQIYILDTIVQILNCNLIKYIFRYLILCIIYLPTKYD